MCQFKFRINQKQSAPSLESRMSQLHVNTPQQWACVRQVAGRLGCHERRSQKQWSLC